MGWCSLGRWRSARVGDPGQYVFSGSGDRGTMRSTYFDKKVGETFRDCEASCPTMVVVPADSFQMGSAIEQEGHVPSEGPQHWVRIEAPFAVGAHEVTVGQYRACVQARGCPRIDGYYREDGLPVTSLSWEEAWGYADWLSETTGQEYRLLSEAEWEYVARAGTITPWYWERTRTATDQCVYENGYDAHRHAELLVSGVPPPVGCWDRHLGAAPVGSYRPNAFGVHDIAANVSEWVSDCWNSDYQGAPTDGSSWLWGDCAMRVVRGGTYRSGPESLRSAFRESRVATRGDADLGFRVARNIRFPVEDGPANREDPATAAPRINDMKESLDGALKVGDRFRDCKDRCPEMVVVPAGSFQMGSSVDEQGRTRSEGPWYRVTISKPFAVGVYELTVAEYRACVEAGRCTPSISRADRHPVGMVDWDDARAYVEWLTEETGEQYRLLTEAEWEYVARAGTITPWYWKRTRTGTDQCLHENGRDAVYHAKVDTETPPPVGCRDRHLWEAPVGSYRPNAFGVYDMAANVSEWVTDCWNSSYLGAPTDGSARLFGDCSQRVTRGGSYESDPASLRSASRGRLPAYMGLEDVGFRIARDIK